MKVLCVSNISKREELIIGQTYDMLETKDEGENKVWIFITEPSMLDNSRMTNYTILCESVDFVLLEDPI